MEQDRKFYARYYIVRAQQALWKGGPAEPGSQYRNIVITSNQFTSTQGKFQVYALEGTGKGIQDGKFAGPENEPQRIFDEDFDGLDAAVAKFEQIVKDSIDNGFTPFSLMDEMELQARLERMK
jgi:hypothetical protein